MRGEAGLPVADSAGQRLVALTRTGEDRVDAGVPCPLALVVVVGRGAVLLGRNRWRQVWELPGGGRESNESVRDAAVRELAEETGLHLTPGDLRWVGLAEFDLVGPVRRERAAVFTTNVAPGAVARSLDGEFTDVVWAPPSSPPPDQTSLPDWAIARWAAGPVVSMPAALTTDR